MMAKKLTYKNILDPSLKKINNNNNKFSKYSNRLKMQITYLMLYLNLKINKFSLPQVNR